MNKNKTSVMGKRLVTLVILFIVAIFGAKAGDIPFLSNLVGDTKVEQTTEAKKVDIIYTFRAERNLKEHFEKHGDEFDYDSEEEYLQGANRVIQSKDVLHKHEEEDGDDVYYLEESNEIVIVGTNGHIRTYFKPSDGKDYYNRQ
jgi:pyocin large subunit-like protein